MKTPEYMLITDSAAESLTIQVNKWLAKGWKLYGNPCMVCNSGSFRYCQAVIYEVSIK